jgi:hypothetical protein
LSSRGEFGACAAERFALRFLEQPLGLFGRFAFTGADWAYFASVGVIAPLVLGDAFGVGRDMI